jgi:hypothetical protein
VQAHIRVISAPLAGLLASLTSAPPALALPEPHHKLYWSSWWEPEEKVWPVTRGRVSSGAATIIFLSIYLRSNFIRRKNSDQAR